MREGPKEWKSSSCRSSEIRKYPAVQLLVDLFRFSMMIPLKASGGLKATVQLHFQCCESLSDSVTYMPRVDSSEDRY